MKLIDKDAVVAKIECLRKNQRLDDIHGQGVLDGLRAIERFLNALDVKEVDEPRYNGFMGKELQMVDDEIHRLENLKVKEVDLEEEIILWAHEFYEIPYDDVQRMAKYFFELGLKAAQEGEDV